MVRKKEVHALRPKYLDVIAGMFVAVLLISNVASTKIVALGPFVFDGGTLLFPLSYIFGDVLTEVYGYRNSRRVIWTGLAANLLMVFVFWVIAKIPAAPDWHLQQAFASILLATPRIVGASVIAYFAGEFANSYLLSRMKIASQGRQLWKRTIGSTLVGQLVDTLLFAVIAFAGTMPGGVLLALIISNYLMKVGIEVLNTPLTYQVVNFLKRQEGIDVFDHGVNYNPFLLK
ncbi:MAG TPA: queuosine precursor transporter [Bacillota bacterium]|nr:queuosine precursor transporter [Bacillota bacterium]HPT66691.1 queuosine precursor transporter [Bacillota bacterium]